MGKRKVFDSVFRTICEKLPRLLIPMINEVFGTEYKDDVEFEQLRNEHMTIRGRVVTDALLRIENRMYHIECQSTADGLMTIRMLEYDFAIAYEEMLKDGRPYVLKFPDSCVLYLRRGDEEKGTYPVIVKFPDGQECTYTTKVINVQDYTADEIVRKRLLLFFPYYILRYEKDMPKAKDVQRLESLLSEYESMLDGMEGILDGDEKEAYYTSIVNMMLDIIDHVVRSKDVKERMRDTMGGKVMKLYSEELIERGIEQGIERGIEQGIEQGIERGIEQGIEQGWRDGIVRMLASGKTPEAIAEFCGYDLEEVRKVQQERKLG